MEDVTSISSGFASDITQLQFYKNPVFIGFCIYVLTVVVVYSSMAEINKVDYVFSNKFRNDGDIMWSAILYYPYDPYSSTASLIKVLATPPIIWYLVVFTLFFTTIINTLGESKKTYFYAVMASWLVILILLTLHMVIFNFIIDPEQVTIELALDKKGTKGKKGKQDKKHTYIEFYRTQWLLLITLSPIYVIMLLYIIRKLGK